MAKMPDAVTVAIKPELTIAGLRVQMEKLNIGKDDYVVITVRQPPYLSREQAYTIFDQMHKAMPHLDRNHIIVKPASIDIEVKTREEVAADADIPSWVRKLRRERR